MRVLIYYFSGTGNTEKVAREYEAALVSEGNEVTLSALPLSGEEVIATHPQDYDLIGIGYPIHAFNAPEVVLKLAKNLPALEGEESKPAFIFKTSGEPVRMSDVSSLKLSSLLRKRGYIVKNEYQYVMPYNMIFRHDDRTVYKMWSTAKAVIPIDVREILDGTPSRPKKVAFGPLIAGVLRIEHAFAHVNAKAYKITDKCVHCNLCVKTCPTENITVDESGKIKFGKNCTMCMRCSFNCPVNAINLGLFEGWKVNGAYSFREPAPDSPPPTKRHAKYCKKAYDRYFSAAEKKIARKNGKTAENNNSDINRK